MNKITKFLIGIGGTSLLAWGAHAITGEKYIADLEARASSGLLSSNIKGVGLKLGHDPLTRVAELSGITDPAMRAEAERAVLAIPGISGVRWSDGSAGGNVVPPAVNASVAGSMASGGSAAVAASCQNQVNSAMQGKVINFKSGSAYMPDSALVVIDGVATALRDCAGTSIAIEGHTDSTGSAAINQTISQSRAEAVSRALAERGIAANRMTATGYGSTRPVNAGNGADAANRRIEFKLGNSVSGPVETPAKAEVE